MVVVFDFDKTLTYKDTLFGFFAACSRNNFGGRLMQLVYFFFMIAHRLRVISNDSLKRIGVWIFLRGKSINYLTECGKQYARNITLNKLYRTEFTKYHTPYVVSASFIHYIAPLLPSAKVLCSEIAFDQDSRVRSLRFNCHGQAKPKALQTCGIFAVDVLYTDSISDLPLAEMSKKIYLVKGDEVVECHNPKEFSALAST